MHFRDCPRRVSGRLVLAVACLAIFLTPLFAVAGPSGTWEQISSPGQTGAAAAYASTTNLLYVFGGDGTSLVHATSAAAPPAEWTIVKTNGTPPSVRSDCAMVFDATGNRLLVFGGRDFYGQAFGDLWQLSLDGVPTWTPLVTGGDAPSARAQAGACFNDSRGILVVFGGVDGGGGLVDGNIHQVDLRQPDPAWTQWSPAGVSPTARRSLVMCDVPEEDGLVVFGGNDGASNLNDAYRMPYGTHEWSAIDGAGDVPPSVTGALGVYDPIDGALLVWGGSGSDGEVHALALATDTWTLAPNISWQSAPVPGAHPVGAWTGENGQFLVLDGDNGAQTFEFHYLPANGSYWQDWRGPGATADISYGSTFVYDPERDIAFLSNGRNGYTQPVQSTWSYGFGAQKGWYNTFFTGIEGNYTPALARHVSVWDRKRNRMLVFGGVDASYARRNDVYAMQDTMGGYYYWHQMAPAGTPPTGRYGTAAIYDPVGDRMLVFGGSDTSGSPRNDLWQLSLSGTPTWTQINAPGGPSAREDHTAIYDAAHHRMIVFGGVNAPSGEVWALNLPSLTWTQLQPTGTMPPMHYQHTAVYDSRRGRMLVFGGGVTWGADARQTWELNLNVSPPVWTLLAPTTTVQGLPVQRVMHAADLI